MPFPLALLGTFSELVNKIFQKNKKSPGNQNPCHSPFSVVNICGPNRGSFAALYNDMLVSKESMTGIKISAISSKTKTHLPRKRLLC